jgi:hypothetical protein
MGKRSPEFGDRRKRRLENEEDMNNTKFDFENLLVYQKALDYVDTIYEITKTFLGLKHFRSLISSGERQCRLV